MTTDQPTNTLTDAEKITLCTCRKGDRAQRCLDRIAAVESILAARGGNTDNTLRAAVRSVLDAEQAWSGNPDEYLTVAAAVERLRDAYIGAPCPTCSGRGVWMDEPCHDCTPTDNQHNNGSQR